MSSWKINENGEWRTITSKTWDGSQWVTFGDDTEGDDIDTSATLTHCWRMSEGSGDTLEDTAVNGDATGTINGADWNSQDSDWYEGYALSGDGSSAYVDTGPHDNEQASTAVVLTALHHYTGDDAGGTENLATSGFDGDTPWEVRFNGTDLEFNVYDGAASTLYQLSEPLSNIPSEIPHRIVAQYGGGEFELWINGTLVDSLTASLNDLTSDSQRLLFAHDDNGTISGYFSGILDNVKIYDGLLTESEIQADYENQPWYGQTIIDSFERSSLQYYSGNTGAFSVASTRSTDGSNALYSSATSNNTIYTSEGDGLDYIPSTGDTVRYDLYPLGGQRFEISLARQDSNNRVLFHVASGSSSEIYVTVAEGGTFTNIAYSNAATIPEDEWLIVELDWGSDDQTFGLTVYDWAGNTIDSTSGSYGSAITVPDPNAFDIIVSGASGAERWADHFRLKNGSTDDGGGDGSSDGDLYDADGHPLPNDDGPFGTYDGDVDSSIDWTLGAADDFTVSSLADTNWNVGFGWGRTHDNTEEYVRDEDVWISSDDRLVLRTTHDGSYSNWYGGAASTYNLDGTVDHTAMHGYWEASIRMHDAIEGNIPGFWARTSDDLSVWPPEIDFMERFGEYPSGQTSAHTVHYNDPPEEEDIRSDQGFYLADGFHVWGCYWTDSYCEYYLDGELIADDSTGKTRTTSGHGTGSNMLEGEGPMYSLFTNHIWDSSWNGDPSNESYPVYTEMDWFRYWSG